MSHRRKSARVNRAWMQRHLSDPYVRRAQQDGFRARAAYKLAEIDEALGLIRPGRCIVDLGAAPGAWSQYVRRRLDELAGPAREAEARVVAMDLLPMEPIDGVIFLQGDFREAEACDRLSEALQGRAVDVALSDMAPNLSGVAASDAARVSDLVERAIDFASEHLQPDGTLVAKLFHGSGYSQLRQQFKETFRVVRPFKPGASRSESSETFLAGIGLRKSR